MNYWDYENFSSENYRQIIFDEVQYMERSHESWSLNNCLNDSNGIRTHNPLVR